MISGLFQLLGFEDEWRRSYECVRFVMNARCVRSGQCSFAHVASSNLLLCYCHAAAGVPRPRVLGLTASPYQLLPRYRKTPETQAPGAVCALEVVAGAHIISAPDRCGPSVCLRLDDWMCVNVLMPAKVLSLRIATCMHPLADFIRGHQACDLVHAAFVSATLKL